jgi:hypothetical protein
VVVVEEDVALDRVVVVVTPPDEPDEPDGDVVA